MERYLETNYIIEALNFYKVENKDEILNILEEIHNDNNLNKLIKKYYDILFINKSDEYKKIKKYDIDSSISNKYNKIILLTGYYLHLQNINKRNYDLIQVNKQINIISNLLNEKYLLFDSLQWCSRFIRGNLFELGPLQYEIMYNNPLESNKYRMNSFIKIHIPQSDNLNIKEVEKSLNNVEEYLKEHFKNINTTNVIYYTESWLLSPELPNLLNSSSNILNFQKYFNIIEIKENKEDFEKFVINNSKRRNTTLQRNLLDYLNNNKILHIGIGILKK